MKLTKTLLIVPVISLLAACGQTEIPVGENSPLIGEKQTEAPRDFVVYPDDRPSIPDGRLVWEKQNCASCHGAQGETPVGESKMVLNDFLFMSGKKPVDLYKMITYGKGDNNANDPHFMQPKLSNREIWNLVFYAKSLGTTPLTKAELEVIDPTFGSNCAVCHGTKGDGDGPLARNLEPMPANFQTMRRFFDRTDDTLYDHIANGIKWEGMPNFLGKVDRKKNVKFDQAYIRKLVQYVRNFHSTNEPTVVTASAAASSTPAPTASTAPAESKTSSSPSEDKGAAQPDETKNGGQESKSESKTELETSSGAEGKAATSEDKTAASEEKSK